MQSVRTKVLMPLLVVGWSLGIGAGCAAATIQSDEIYADDPAFRIADDSEIEDTTRNREVLDVLAQYRKAVVRKDFGTLKRVISKNYYDNGGTTATTDDDYGYEELANVFERMAQHAEEIKYRVTVRDVTYERERARVTYEYKYAYKYVLGEKPTWDAGTEVNRTEMVREDGRWKIIGGL